MLIPFVQVLQARLFGSVVPVAQDFNQKMLRDSFWVVEEAPGHSHGGLLVMPVGTGDGGSSLRGVPPTVLMVALTAGQSVLDAGHAHMGMPPKAISVTGLI